MKHSQGFGEQGKMTFISGEQRKKGQRGTCIKRLFWSPYEVKK